MTIFGIILYAFGVVGFVWVIDVLWKLLISLEPVIVELVFRMFGHSELTNNWQPSAETPFGKALETIHHAAILIAVLISAILEIIKLLGWH